MITRRLSVDVLGISALVTCLGCTQAIEPSVTTTEPPVQVQRHPNVAFAAVNDDLIRCRLLMLETVQNDLGLTADQVGRLKDLAKVSQERSRQVSAELHASLSVSQAVPSEEGQASQKELLARLEVFRREGREFRQKLLAMLTPRQKERLEQIQLQASTPAALARPEIIQSLAISSEQSDQVAALCSRMKQQQAAAWPNLQEVPPQERAKRMTEFMKASDQAQMDATQQILEVLTPEQRAKLDQLQGKLVDLQRNYDAVTPEEIEFWQEGTGTTP